MALATSFDRHHGRIMRATFALLLMAMLVVVAASQRSAAASPAEQSQAPTEESQVALAGTANQAATAPVALTTTPSGSDLVVYRGIDDAVYLRTLTNTSWSAQSSLGGVIVGAPSIAATGSGGYIVAARGPDGGLWIRRCVSGIWQSWESLGGLLSAAPAVVATPDGRIDIFVRGNNDALFTRSKPVNGVWSPWRSLGGNAISGPAAVAFWSGRIEVYVTAGNYAIYRNSLSNGVWSGWLWVGGRTYNAPAAAAIAGGSNVRLFVRGTTGAVSVNTRISGSWSGWQSLNGTAVDAPAATGRPDGGADVVVRSTDNALWTKTLRKGVWSAFVRGWSPDARPAPPASRRGVDWTAIPTSSRVVALTFDAGANAAGFASIRSTLQRKNAPATFFLTGDWVRRYPAGAVQAATFGARIGNHSDTHPHFPQLTDAQVSAQIRTTERWILVSTGADARPLFRFPYGDVNSRVLTDVNNLNYVAVRWTVDSLGWQGTSGGQSAQRVIDRVLSQARPGAIILMHMGSNPTDGTTLDAAALPQIIDGLRARGYGFVTLNALAG